MSTREAQTISTSRNVIRDLSHAGVHQNAGRSWEGGRQPGIVEETVITKGNYYETGLIVI